MWTCYSYSKCCDLKNILLCHPCTNCYHSNILLNLTYETDCCSPGPGQQELSGSNSDQSTRSDSPNLVYFNGEMPSVPPVNSQSTGLLLPTPRLPLHSILDGTQFQPLPSVYAPVHHPPSCPPHQPSPTPPRNTSSTITSKCVTMSTSVGVFTALSN